MTEHPNLFDLADKTFYKIGEVADAVGVKPYVLRYWESEFNSLSPHKSGQSKHRMYTREDLELLLTIKSLLYDEMYTVAGARRQLAALARKGEIGTQAAGEVDDDPLNGTERAALEQEVQEFKTRLEQVEAQRDEALALARETGEAIAEVEAARSVAELRAVSLESAAEGSPEPHAAVAALEAALAEARERIDQLEEHRAGLLEAAWPDEQQGQLLATAAGASALSPEDREREMRNKLAYQTSSRRRLLKELRAQVADMLDLVKPIEETAQVAEVGAVAPREQAAT